MKIKFIYILILITVSSCKAQNSKINLNPTMELVNKTIVNFENNEFSYMEIDSVLKSYKSSISDKYKDSIRVKLIVNTEVVTLDKVSDIKIALRRNKLIKITYVPKNDDR